MRSGRQSAVGAEAEGGAGVGEGEVEEIGGGVVVGGVRVGVVFVAVENDVGVVFDADFDLGVAERRVAEADGEGGGAAGGQGKAEGEVGGEVHFVGDDVEEAGDFGFGHAVEVGAHAGQVYLRAFGADFDDEFVGGFIHEGPGVVDPAA